MRLDAAPCALGGTLGRASRAARRSLPSCIPLGCPCNTAARDEPTARRGRTDDALQDALIARLQAGEQQALAELYDRLGRRAFGLAYRVVGDAGAAEEAVQEAFFAIWRQAQQLDPRQGGLDSLLLTIVHRRSIDLLRARRRRELPLATLDDQVTDEQASTLFEQTFQSLMLEDVVAALQSIGREQREAIELAYFEGLTAREIAERSGTPVGTAKSRLRLGLHKLREALGAQVGTDS